jgi:hypothetical protein
MSGWIRLSVVLSVLWFVGFFAFGWISITHQVDASQQQLADTCDNIYQDNGNDAELTKCLRSAYSLSYPSFRNDGPLLAAIDLGLLVAFWVIVGGCIATGRWVYRGLIAAS